MPASLSWLDLIAPLQHFGLLIQIMLLMLLAGAVLHWAPGTLRLVFSTLALYASALLVLVLSNFAALQGWTEANLGLRNLSLLIMGIAAIRLAGALLFRVLLPKLKFAPPSILEDLLVFAAYLIWALFRLAQLGFDLGSILTTSAVLTAIVAISLQDTLGNILGGTALQLDNSLHIGDWIKVGDTVGRVVDIRWRSTLIETRNWETVVMPNATLMKTEFSILGRRSGESVQLRRWVYFSVAFDTSPRKVIDVVETALQRAKIPNVSAYPVPNCVVMDVNGSVIEYAARYWLTNLHVDDPTDSSVRQCIYAAFQRSGISFAFPEQTLHLVKEGEKRTQHLRERELARRIQILRSIELFGALSDDELQALARHLVRAPFVSGETLTEQGDVAHWLYLLVSGKVEVRLETDHGQRRVGSIEAGNKASLFGEMGLLTGAPRTATVVAVSDVECYRLTKSGFEGVIRSRPAIAEELSQLMAGRQEDLLEAQDALAKARSTTTPDKKRNEILNSIRQFFHLNDQA